MMSNPFKLFEPNAVPSDLMDEIRLVLSNSGENTQALIELRKKFEAPQDPEMMSGAVAASILCDLSIQGWDVIAKQNQIQIRPPEFNRENGESLKSSKARLRDGLHLNSNRQFLNKPTSTFLSKMEKPRSFNGQTFSILSLIDDGPELVAELDCPVDNIQTIDPIIELCTDKVKCARTGLKLLDIWRYFRLTWSLSNNPVPGRTMRLLIRNKARPNWPIIGLAMIASPSANMSSRDEWLEWRTDEVIKNLLSKKWKSKDISNWLLGGLEESIGLIRHCDLVKKEELSKPTLRTFYNLEQIIHQAKRSRAEDLTNYQSSSEQIRDIRDVKFSTYEEIPNRTWKRLSETPLYRKKRAEQLRAILKAKRYFLNNGLENDSDLSLLEILTTPKGRGFVTFALNEIKKNRLSSEVADVAVCGAIEPYNHLLGGKLVAMLVASQEVRDLYRDRYGSRVSEIASQMAGRKVIRDADLKALTTTSLYGVGSSQYNRLRFSKSRFPKLKQNLIWEELSNSSGFTITHFSPKTNKLMREHSLMVHGHHKVNSVFGEGSSPKTRQLKLGMTLIGFHDAHIFEQSIGRKVYGCELYPKAKQALLGINSKPRKLNSNSVKIISEVWLKRWLSPRLQRPDIRTRLLKFSKTQIPNSFKDRRNEALRNEGIEPDQEYRQTEIF